MLQYQKSKRLKNEQHGKTRLSSHAARSQISGLARLHQASVAAQQSAAQPKITFSQSTIPSSTLHSTSSIVTEPELTDAEQAERDWAVVDEELARYEAVGTLDLAQMENFDLVFHWEVCGLTHFIRLSSILN